MAHEDVTGQGGRAARFGGSLAERELMAKEFRETDAAQMQHANFRIEINFTAFLDQCPIEDGVFGWKNIGEAQAAIEENLAAIRDAACRNIFDKPFRHALGPFVEFDEVAHPRGGAARIAVDHAAADGVGFVLLEIRDDAFEPIRIGHTIRVGEGDILAGGAHDAEIAPAAGIRLPLQPKQPHGRKFFFNNIAGAVVRAVDDDHFERMFRLLRQNRAERLTYRAFGVEGGHDDGNGEGVVFGLGRGFGLFRVCRRFFHLHDKEMCLQIN